MSSRFLMWPGEIVNIDGDSVTVKKFGKKDSLKTYPKDKVEKFDMAKRNSNGSEMKNAYKKAKIILDSVLS